MSAAREKSAATAPVEQLDWRSPEITALLERALAEDIGSGDLTTDAIFSEPRPAVGTFIANEALVVCGLPLVARLYELLDPALRFEPLVEEGAQVGRGKLAVIRGDARTLLRGERVVLNFLQRLCGIATLTRRFVVRLQGTKARLRDTRKTTPGLRQLERYAVRVGGGSNHRAGLFDAVLIKENHAQLAGGVAEAVRRARRRLGPGRPLQVEVHDAAEMLAAVDAGADLLLFDNMTIESVDLCAEALKGRVPVEASGGIRIENIRTYAECGVDLVAVGALTHSAPAADISLDLVPADGT